ncbi:hypothetical protein [Haliangium ochraceum]|uniref:Uncharacterized protein n=1 Tax=Haliangium ochraceum (strain DSM 14365 / JCM 11303 / SMP-2) TaxID=502025 RepID=D0LVM7_HALO1|nr:hypothetical protein [Haliangium ochraceum]ACY19345.1 hypothetical protein Hoch_6882 [Haliangium ochraceum DSM 14365]
MTHPKDIDKSDTQAAEPAEDALLLVDLLYGELDDAARERAEARLREDEGLAEEYAGLSSVRALMRDLPDEEPPDALTAKILHAAASQHASAPVRAATREGADEESPSLWARIQQLFMPLVMNPGLAAAASVALIAGATGLLYVSGNLAPKHEMVTAASDEAAAPMPMGEAKAENKALGDGAEYADGDDAEGGEFAGALEPEPEMVAELEAPADTAAATGRGGGDGLAQAPAEKDSAASATSEVGSKRARTSVARRQLSKPAPSADMAFGDKASAADRDSAFVGGLAAKGENAKLDERKYAQEPPPAPVARSEEQSASLGSSTAAKKKITPSKSAPAAAPPPPAPQQRARVAEEVATADAAEDEAPSRATRQAPEGNRSGSGGAAPGTAAGAEADDAGDDNEEVRGWYERALEAAKKGNCGSVRVLGRRVQKSNRVFYRDVFAKDERLARCLAGASK